MDAGLSFTWAFLTVPFFTAMVVAPTNVMADPAASNPGGEGDHDLEGASVGWPRSEPCFVRPDQLYGAQPDVFLTSIGSHQCGTRLF